MNIQTAPELTLLCLYHYVDPESQVILGYIGQSQIVKREDGSLSYLCMNESTKPEWKFWKLVGVFIAVSPLLRPIPTGMRLFCAKTKNSYPYDTESVETVYDPFNAKENCNYFITYTQPTPGTVPLYLHKLGDGIFPSFDKNPPTDNPNWNNEILNPIFVMTPNSLGIEEEKFNSEDINFYCLNNRCLPWTKDTDTKYISEYNKYKIDECVIRCNQTVLTTSGKPLNILQKIQNQSKIMKYQNLSKIFKKCPPFLISIVIFLFVISLLIVLIMLIKNKNEKTS